MAKTASTFPAVKLDSRRLLQEITTMEAAMLRQAGIPLTFFRVRHVENFYDHPLGGCACNECVARR